MAPTRKNDPNVNFPWKQLSEKGFGQWWDDTTGIEVPQHFDGHTALRIIGYDLRDTAAAIEAFHRRYVQQDKVRSFSEGSLKILYRLSAKYR